MKSTRSPEVDLTNPDPTAPEITVYPAALAKVVVGGCGIGNATHHLRILLPHQQREIRIPFNVQSLNQIGRAMIDAADTSNSLDVKEDSTQ